jgi:hypothetical protein
LKCNCFQISSIEKGVKMGFPTLRKSLDEIKGIRMFFSGMGMLS